MKKFLFMLALVVLFSLAACNNETQNGTVQADIPNDTIQLDNTPWNPGGIFCTEGLAEGEVLIVSVSGDEDIPGSIDEMIRFIDMAGVWQAGYGMFRSEIVRAEVLDERTEWHNTTAAWHHEGAQPFLVDDPGWDHSDRYEPYTFHRVRVLEVFKGEVAAGDILEVMQEGGQIDNVRLENYSFVSLTPGDDVVLFLASPVWMPNSPAALMSSFTAVYRFPDLSGGIRAFGLDEGLESVYEFPEHMAEYALTLTLDDLADMQLENFGRVSESFEAALEAARR